MSAVCYYSRPFAGKRRRLSKFGFFRQRDSFRIVVYIGQYKRCAVQRNIVRQVVIYRRYNLHIGVDDYLHSIFPVENAEPVYVGYIGIFCYIESMRTARPLSYDLIDSKCGRRGRAYLPYRVQRERIVETDYIFIEFCSVGKRLAVSRSCPALERSARGRGKLTCEHFSHRRIRIIEFFGRKRSHCAAAAVCVESYRQRVSRPNRDYAHIECGHFDFGGRRIVCNGIPRPVLTIIILHAPIRLSIVRECKSVRGNSKLFAHRFIVNSRDSAGYTAFLRAILRLDDCNGILDFGIDLAHIDFPRCGKRDVLSGHGVRCADCVIGRAVVPLIE